MGSYNKLWPAERSVVIIDDIGGFVPHNDVVTLIHSSVEARETLEVKGIRGFVYHRAILNRLRGNCKIYCYLLLLFIIAYFA